MTHLKIFTSLFTLLLLFSAPISIAKSENNTQPAAHNHKDVITRVPAPVLAKKSIQKTKLALQLAKQAVKKGKINAGMAKAIRHYKIAAKHLKNKVYGKSIRHSVYARELAFDIIKANNSTIDKKSSFDPDEAKYQEAITRPNMDKNLDIEHTDIHPGLTDDQADAVEIK